MDVKESGFDEFIDHRKEDLKKVKEEVKHFFGNVSALGKKAFSKKPPAENPPAAVPEKKPSGFKVFGSKVKMGFSKLFNPNGTTSKGNPVAYEEHKEDEELLARHNPLAVSQYPEAGNDDLKLIDDEAELN